MDATIAGQLDLILERVSDGASIDDMLNDYSHLTRAQVVAALAYAVRRDPPNHSAGW